ncbi:MAG: glutamine-hydrolyzing carbamoyl-phosphate synthase small subunit [Bdellovibrionaceae bacterium]|nr:glutamine-hydrolyzing carbamoyl-phosphate synthase small subunit [Pseudobdellovibrionaceae bacterium]
MKAWLVLETGETFEGTWNGGEDRAGEVVFNTSHSGYEEIATDPSYLGQIVCMTAPMMGNYGVDKGVWESRKIWIEGFICLQLQKTTRDQSWMTRLTEAGIPILSDVDTRNLVIRLRSGGTPLGALVRAETSEQAQQKSRNLIEAKRGLDKDWVHIASRKETEDRSGKNMVGPRIAVLDFGSKENILRELESRSSALRIFPSRASAEQVMSWKPDGVMLTNGPGDPADVKVAVETVRDLLGNIPIFGICMGHQILALALGAKTYKMKFGHRGSNHPIRDDLLGMIYVTSQNHGYAVDAKTLPTDVKVTHVNLNDQTVAGICSETRRCLGIQYHPEACPGPHEAQKLFQFFMEKMI